ncbi:hypothetical protein JCM11491_004893 [Sporobolomyces phaffii]
MSYPPAPTNQLQQALERRDTMTTVQLTSSDDDATASRLQRPSDPEQVPGDDKDAMHLRGGCIDLSPCGCDCEFCCIPCTIM